MGVFERESMSPLCGSLAWMLTRSWGCTQTRRDIWKCSLCTSLIGMLQEKLHLFLFFCSCYSLFIHSFFPPTPLSNHWHTLSSAHNTIRSISSFFRMTLSFRKIQQDINPGHTAYTNKECFMAKMQNLSWGAWTQSMWAGVSFFEDHTEGKKNKKEKKKTISKWCSWRIQASWLKKKLPAFKEMCEYKNSLWADLTC